MFVCLIVSRENRGKKERKRKLDSAKEMGLVEREILFIII